MNHFLHTKIPNRMLINKCLKKITNKNVKIVTPSNLWDNNSKWDFLKDEKHYKNLKVIKRVANYIDLHIYNLFNIFFYKRVLDETANCS